MINANVIKVVLNVSEAFEILKILDRRHFRTQDFCTETILVSEAQYLARTYLLEAQESGYAINLRVDPHRHITFLIEIKTLQRQFHLELSA